MKHKKKKKKQMSLKRCNNLYSNWRKKNRNMDKVKKAKELSSKANVVR